MRRRVYIAERRQSREILMNSTFHGDAVIEQSKWLRPQPFVNDIEKPRIAIYGQHLNKLTKRQLQLCPNEKERYDHPYEVKPNKRNRRKTIFPKIEETWTTTGERNFAANQRKHAKP